MKELHEISQQLKSEPDLNYALATVVEVVGSAYRKPGARMLVASNGASVGAISGGCLEDDVRRKAQKVIQLGTPRLYTYETTDDPESEGLKLGCNGTISILIEPCSKSGHPFLHHALLESNCSSEGSVLIIAFSSKLSTNQVGTCAGIINDTLECSTDLLASKDILLSLARRALNNNTSMIEDWYHAGETYTLFAQFIPATITLHIFGAGYDVDPLIRMTEILGWEAHVYNYKISSHPGRTFPVHKLKAADIQNTFTQLRHMNRWGVIIMSHQYKYDQEVLQNILKFPIGYIGLLGPKSKLQRMIAQWEVSGIDYPHDIYDRVRNPIGLNIGSETPEEIALSIASEVLSVYGSRKFKSVLKDKQAH